MADAAAYAASANPERGIIRYPDFVLYPSDVNSSIAAKPTRILFVKGVPKMMSDVRLKFLFTQFGPVFSINKGRENEYTVEYFDEYYAQKATCLSGYTIKLENKDETGYVGNLRMTYLIPQDDFSDDEIDPSSPPTKKEFKNLNQKLSNPDTLSEGTEILKVWLKNNRCIAKNANEFQSLLETAFRTSKRLVKDKNRCNEQIRVAEANYRKAIAGIAVDINQIGRIFNHANYDKMADSFPEEERQNLMQWKKEFLCASQEINEEVPNKKKKKKKNRSRRKQKKQNHSSPKAVSPGGLFPRDESPGGLSPTEESFSHLTVAEMSHGERLRLLAEKEDLQLQLDAAEANRECERIEHAARYGYLNQSLYEAHMKCLEYESQLADWKQLHEKSKKNHELESDEETAEYNQASNLSIVDARLFAALTYFLEKRKQGATLGDIRNHLRRRDFHASGRYIADMMRQFPALFKEVKDGDESGKVKWVFTKAEVQCA